MYFFAALIGIFAGLYAGLSIRSFCICRNEKKTYKRYYVKKKKEKKRLTKHFHKPKLKKIKLKKISLHKREESSLLTERVPETESFTSFKCDSFGDDSIETIEKNRKTQDEKYVRKAKK